MERKLLVSDSAYWKHPIRPLQFDDWVTMLPSGSGAWQIRQCDKDGSVILEQWIRNKMLNAVLKNSFAASPGNPFKYIALANGAGVTALTSALSNGQTYISLAVGALPAAIASGTSIIIGAGTGQTQTVATSGSASVGATSISVNSFVANATYAIGSNVSPQPTANDNPSSLPGTLSSYSAALGSGSFSYTNNVAIGPYTFDISGSPAASNGTYTEAWVTNTSPVAAIYQTGIHNIFNAPMSINSGAPTLEVTITETIS